MTRVRSWTTPLFTLTRDCLPWIFKNKLSVSALPFQLLSAEDLIFVMELILISLCFHEASAQPFWWPEMWTSVHSPFPFYLDTDFSCSWSCPKHSGSAWLPFALQSSDRSQTRTHSNCLVDGNLLDPILISHTSAYSYFLSSAWKCEKVVWKLDFFGLLAAFPFFCRLLCRLSYDILSGHDMLCRLLSNGNEMVTAKCHRYYFLCLDGVLL